MNVKNLRKVKCILAVYLIATLMLLLLGYSIQKPKIARQEFPFTITYSYQGDTQTISDVYVGEYVRKAKYLGDNSTAWRGYIQGHDRLEWDFYRIGQQEGNSFSINLNMLPGYLMGDPGYEGAVCQPEAVCHSFDGTNEIEIIDPAELAELGFAIVDWEYPRPIANQFSFGGISLSSQAALCTAGITLIALLACMILIKKDKELMYGMADKISIVLNFLMAFAVFPFCLILSALTEIVADTSIWQQLLYLSPALILLGIAASVVMRRCGYGKYGLLAQFAGPVIYIIVYVLSF